MFKGHIVFDFDGTLFGNTPGILKGWRKVLSELLGREVTMQEIVAKSCPDPVRFLSAFDLDHNKEELQHYLSQRWPEIYSSQEFGEEIFDGITELLEKLEQLNYGLYIWSAGYKKAILETLKRYNISQYFIEVKALEDGFSKPHPQQLYDMLGEVDKKHVIVIGDSYTDITGAFNYGCPSIAALWNDREKHKQLAQCGAQYFAHHPEECLDIIENYFETLR